MAGMAVAWGTKAAMVPAGGLRGRTSIDARGAVAGAAAAAAGGAVSGLGWMSLRRLQSNRVVISSPSDAKRSLTVVAVRTTEETELADVTEVQEAGAQVQPVLEDLLKQIKDTWAKVDDKLAIGSLGVIAIIALWGSNGLISAIDKLPLIPQLLELVGLLYTGWFIYRYLLFKPDREELLKVVDDTKAKITGQEDL